MNRLPSPYRELAVSAGLIGLLFACACLGAAF